MTKLVIDHHLGYILFAARFPYLALTGLESLAYVAFLIDGSDWSHVISNSACDWTEGISPD